MEILGWILTVGPLAYMAREVWRDEVEWKQRQQEKSQIIVIEEEVDHE